MDAAAAPVLSPAALHERYDRYALTIRSVSPELVRKRSVYLERLFRFLGPPPSAAALFAGLTVKRIAAFLADSRPAPRPRFAAGHARHPARVSALCL